MITGEEFKLIAQRDIFHKSKPSMVTDTQFQALFGVAAEICAPVYKFIRQRIDIIEEEEEYRSFEPLHLLWGLHLMKAYGTTKNVSKFMGTSENTFIKWSLFVVRQISCMKEKVVSNNQIESI